MITVFPDSDAVANLGDPGQRWLTAQGTYFGAEADLEIGFMKGDDNVAQCKGSQPGKER